MLINIQSLWKVSKYGGAINNTSCFDNTPFAPNSAKIDVFRLSARDILYDTKQISNHFLTATWLRRFFFSVLQVWIKTDLVLLHQGFASENNPFYIHTTHHVLETSYYGLIDKNVTSKKFHKYIYLQFPELSYLALRLVHK